MAEELDDRGTASLRLGERCYDSPVLQELIGMVEADHRRILDVGTGTGSNLRAMKARGHLVTGMTISWEEAVECSRGGFQVVVADAAQPHLPFADQSFDGVLLSHVLEHLQEPASLLAALRPLVAEGGAIYVALPNAVHYKQRWEFMRGRFRYSETGIMDQTHLRFFDIGSARLLIEGAGYRIADQRVSGAVPSLGLRGKAPKLWSKLDEVGLARFPGLFGFHLMYKAVPAR